MGKDVFASPAPGELNGAAAEYGKADKSQEANGRRGRAGWDGKGGVGIITEKMG